MHVFRGRTSNRASLLNGEWDTGNAAHGLLLFMLEQPRMIPTWTCEDKPWLSGERTHQC